jgi:hypothetical protein
MRKSAFIDTPGDGIVHSRTLERLRDPPRNGESRDDLGRLSHCLLRIFAPRDWCILVYIAGRRI